MFTPEQKPSIVDNIPVPRGWTTLIHGTDTSRWQIGEKQKIITGYPGLSAITNEEAARNAELSAQMGNPGAYDTTANYADRNPSAKRVDVRVLFYQEQLSGNRVSAQDVSDIKAGLSPATQILISKYHQPRHPVVPPGEVLLSLGETIEEQDCYVEYFVPQSVAAAYMAALQAEDR